MTHGAFPAERSTLLVRPAMIARRARCSAGYATQTVGSAVHVAVDVGVHHRALRRRHAGRRARLFTRHRPGRGAVAGIGRGGRRPVPAHRCASMGSAAVNGSRSACAAVLRRLDRVPGSLRAPPAPVAVHRPRRWLVVALAGAGVAADRRRRPLSRGARRRSRLHRHRRFGAGASHCRSVRPAQRRSDSSGRC